MRPLILEGTESLSNQELAARVERAIQEHDDRETIEQLVGFLAAAHGKLVGALKDSLAEPDMGAAESAAVHPVDRAQALAACKTLDEFLTNDDGEATDFINEARDLLLGILGADPFQALKKAADNYDFEKARELLRARATE